MKEEISVRIQDKTPLDLLSEDLYYLCRKITNFQRALKLYCSANNTLCLALSAFRFALCDMFTPWNVNHAPQGVHTFCRHQAPFDLFCLLNQG